MGGRALYHRSGEVLETLSTSERRTNRGRTKRYTRCRVRWEDGAGPEFIDLSADYRPEQRMAVIYRDQSQICDINLDTGQQSVIGDRVEGVLALLLFISVPLCFVLIGIPLYLAVRWYARATTDALRRRVAAYAPALLAAAGPRSFAGGLAGAAE